MELKNYSGLVHVGLIGHGEDFGFYSGYSGKPLNVFRHGSHMNQCVFKKKHTNNTESQMI